ncbi:cyanophycin synthetase [Sphingomonas sp. TX0543]|uniref:cyanophycin synthetase n=1 Tax=unclassified Sphingomonas TaxID=196159 RepID=UPI00201681F1|nr:cyanophycin synthetase [Sphingomonas sp. 3P27F8]
MESFLLSARREESDLDGTISHVSGITIVERAIYRGPNIHSRRAMVRIRIDLGPLETRPTDTLPGFAAALLDLLPGLRRHHCSKGRAGGLVERMAEGTWLGHVAEHVALELQSLAGADVTRGKTRSVAGRPGFYDILFEYRDEQAALLAGLHALRIVSNLLPGEFRELRGERVLPATSVPNDAPLAAVVAELGSAIRKTSLGPSTQAIVDAAKQRGIPVSRLDDRSLIQLGIGRRQRRIRASVTGQTSHVAVELAGDKQLTRQLLRDAALPAPRGAVTRSLDEAIREAKRLASPWVVKPLNANHGRGVSLNVSGEAALARAFETARDHSPRVIVEEQIVGEDHRFLVVGGKVVAVARRLPAAVLGDGASDVAALVARANEDPRRGVGHENLLTRIVIDSAVERVLEDQGLSSTSIPEAGRLVRLRETANLSTGGTAEDCTDDVHPENIFVAEQAAAAIGLDVAGIDFLSPDITRPVSETGGGIVEVNAAPGLRMHLAPSSGSPRDVAGPIVDLLFPRASASRIPIIAITGTNGKSTTARMVARILRERGMTVGLTSTTGIYIGDRLIKSADASGPKSARMILGNPTVDAAVLETARGGLLREGLGFDRCDVGCVLNVTEDHLGLKGINSVQDLANVKSVVVEAVARRGCSVLNADDPLTRRMARSARGRLCWFSMAAPTDEVRDHVAAGGLAVTREPEAGEDVIVLYRNNLREVVVPVGSIPATLAGAAAFNTENALAATAMAVALGVETAIIAAALSSFSSSYSESPGRLNIVDRGGVTVIVDYAHNPAAVTALSKFLDTLRKPGRRFIGVYSVPGDRRDEDLVGMGKLAASIFDELVFRETPDGRGRPRGEINAMMSKGALSAGLSGDRIHRIVDEAEATAFSLSLAKPGDVVVLSPSQVDLVWKIVCAFEPAKDDELVNADG